MLAVEGVCFGGTRDVDWNVDTGGEDEGKIITRGGTNSFITFMGDERVSRKGRP